MPKPLSVRDQNNFISAYKNLLNENDGRIHNKNVNTLNKLLENCETVVVSQLLMTKMAYDYPKDPDALKSTFGKLFDKLISQETRGKKAKLKNIQQKLEPVVIQLNQLQTHKNNVKTQIDIISSKIDSDNKDIITNKNIISLSKNKIRMLKKELEPIENTIKTTTAQQFSQLDAMYKKKYENKINELTSDYENKIDNIKSRIELLNYENIAFISSVKNNDISSDLERAMSGEFLDIITPGSVPITWLQHISSDEYTMQKFGYIENSSNLPPHFIIRVPNDAGRQWQTSLRSYQTAQERKIELETEMLSIQNSQRNSLLSIELEKQQSPEQILHKMIAEINKDIATYATKITLSTTKIKNSQKSISSKNAQIKLLLEK